MTSAVLAGSVGGASTAWFEYGTSSLDRRVPASGGSGPVTVSVSGLHAGTRYRYRLVASGPGGTAAGDEGTFTTDPLPDGWYQNPLAGTFPDPFGFGAPGGAQTTYYAYSTGDGFPILRSPDLVHWTRAGTALSSRPSWVAPTGDWHPWGPSAIHTASPCPDGTDAPGCWLLFFTGLDTQLSPAANCVGVAWATSPAGPFTDSGAPLDTDPASTGPPIGCGDANGRGNIDPNPFVDADGKAYLYTSTDFACSAGTSCTLRPTISVIPLTSDLRHAAAARVPLLSGRSGTWEGPPGMTPTVEGPVVERHGTTYYLFYSGGSWRGAYGEGYATATSALGPFQPAATPILTETADVLGPGGGTPIVGPHGGEWLLYHAREVDHAHPRTLRIDPLVWHDDGSVTVAGPTTAPQGAAP